MTMAAMNMVSAGGFSGVSFHSRRFPQGVASVLCKKTPIFGSRRSKLDHLTVFSVFAGVITKCGVDHSRRRGPGAQKRLAHLEEPHAAPRHVGKVHGSFDESPSTVGVAFRFSCCLLFLSTDDFFFRTSPLSLTPVLSDHLQEKSGQGAREPGSEEEKGQVMVIKLLIWTDLLPFYFFS
jgi:hypothetical protein